MTASGPPRRPHVTTPLQQYLETRGIPSAAVEAVLRKRLKGRAPDRKTFARWRHGRVDIRRKDMVRVLWAVRTASRDASIRMEEIFDLDPENDLNWED